MHLALLGLLVGFAELTAGEDEDYYMQEMLTRDLYNQVQIRETPEALISDDPSKNPAKKLPKEKNTGTERNSILLSIISISRGNFSAINVTRALSSKSEIIYRLIVL